MEELRNYGALGCRPPGYQEIFLIKKFSSHDPLCASHSYNLGSGVASIVVNGTFSDGKWHKVKAVR